MHGYQSLISLNTDPIISSKQIDGTILKEVGMWQFYVHTKKVCAQIIPACYQKDP